MIINPKELCRLSDKICMKNVCSKRNNRAKSCLNRRFMMVAVAITGKTDTNLKMELPRQKKIILKISMFFKKNIFFGGMCLAFFVCFGANTQAIAKHVILTVGLPEHHEPYTRYSSRRKRHVGFAQDVADALCQGMGAQCHYVYGNYSELNVKLFHGSVDFVVGAYELNHSSERAFEYTDYFIKTYPVIVSANYNLNFSSASDLSNYNFGVKTSSGEAEILARERNFRQIAYYTLYGSYEDMFSALERGDVDALYLDNLSAYSMLRRWGPIFYLCPDKFNQKRKFSDVRIVLPQGRLTLKTELDKLLDKFKEDRTLYRLSLDYMPNVENGL